MARDMEAVRAEAEAFNPRIRKKSKSGTEKRVAEAWSHTAHGDWDRVGPQWQGFILKMVHTLEGTA